MLKLTQTTKILGALLARLLFRTRRAPLDPAMMARLADEVAEDTVGFSDMHKGGTGNRPT